MRLLTLVTTPEGADLKAGGGAVRRRWPLKKLVALLRSCLLLLLGGTQSVGGT